MEYDIRDAFKELEALTESEQFNLNDEDEEDPRQELVDTLMEYQKLKKLFVWKS